MRFRGGQQEGEAGVCSERCWLEVEITAPALAPPRG